MQTVAPRRFAFVALLAPRLRAEPVWDGRDRHHGDVPVEPLRAAFLASGMSKGELARRMGWMRPHVDQVNRALGLRPDSNTLGVRQVGRKKLTYRLAVRLAEALGVDPWEAGV